MSKSLKIQNTYGRITTKKDKVINILLNEITFMDQCFYKAPTVKAREPIKVALETFENLLKVQGHMDKNLSDEDYMNYIRFIRSTIKIALNSMRSEVLL